MAKEKHYVKMTSKEKAAISNQLAALFLFKDSLNYWKQNLTLFQLESICKKDDPLHPQLLALWKEWEDNCSGKKWDVNEWYQVMLENILSSLLKWNCCFEAVRDTVRVYINAKKSCTIPSESWILKEYVLWLGKTGIVWPIQQLQPFCWNG